jgi:hypothetical protein
LQGEAVAAHFAAGGLQFLVVGFDFMGPGALGSVMVQQRRAGKIGERKVSSMSSAVRP